MTETSNSKKQVRDYAERINNLLNQQKAMGDDIKEIKADAAKICSPSALMKAIRLLRKPAAKRNEEQEELDLVMNALDGVTLPTD